MRNRKITFVCFSLLSLAMIGAIWALADDDASSSSLLKEKGQKESFEDVFASVRSKILLSIKKTGVPSISVAVAKNGKIIWEEAFGWANREKRIKASPHTMYSLASISKPITATGLMILVERGLVDLNKPANNYLGRGKLSAFEGEVSDATVKRVLHHTAGLPTHWNFYYENDSRLLPSMDEAISRYGILVAPPGEGYNYSNLGYGIIDYIISRVSGKSYGDFMRAEVFNPLGMTRTSINIGPGLEDYVAERYDGNQNPIPFYDFDHRGASDVYSSAHDLVRFGMFHLKNHLSDQKQVLKDKTIDSMQQQVDPSLPKSGYKLGWSVIENDHGYRSVGHSGGMPGVSTELRFIPSENIAVVALCNGRNAYAYGLDQDIFAALLPEYAKNLEAERKKKRKPRKLEKFSPAESLLGEWKGEIKTYSGVMPINMVFQEDGDIHIKIRGQLENLLNNVNFRDGMLRGRFNGEIKTEDTSPIPHVINLNMKLRDKKLSGFAAAISQKSIFCLPSYIQLEKTQKKKD
ncbi:MAG: beta-lactamase family protein [Candidatus Aminicenantes bacterium]|nr:MAG: beta-lactamase family protein [Candidatus Aminicenantes bacterium]